MTILRGPVQRIGAIPASIITGQVPVANGGTGASTAQGAQANLKGVYILSSGGVQVSHTGDTNEFTLATITVPANAMGANGAIRVTATWSNNNSATGKTFRIKFGGNNYISGTATTNICTRAQTEIHNRNATNSQVGGFSAASGFGGSTTLITSAVDTTSAVTILITGQLALLTDTVSLENYLVELIVP